MSGVSLKGQCLCGGVKFEATLEKRQMGACHCSMCRRWSGGVFLVAEFGAGALKVADESQLGVYKSSEWGERCFCKTCGSTLFWRMQDGSAGAISIQAFDDPGQFEFVQEIFVDEQPRNYAFSNATQRLTGQQFLDAFAAGKGE